jgi:ABC-2 type transport system ATP-binding protein
MSVLEVEGLRKAFRQVQALDGLSFAVEAGTVFGFLGPNGAGKTTTLRILAGLARPDSGSACVAGHPAGPASPARRLVGYLPEEPRFYTWMTATEFLRDYVAGLFGLKAEEARRRTNELLSLVGLQDAARRRIAGFSRGMRQRLGLAQALLNRPQVVLLDEPVSALDPAGRRDMLLLIEELRRTTTVLMSTHILEDVERVCDSVGIIKDGRMVTVDERQALLDRYATPLIEIAFRAHPDRIGAWAEQIRRLPGVVSAVTDEALVRIQLGTDLAADQQVLAQAVASGMPVERFEHGRPKLEDVFLRLVGQAKEAA